MELHASQTAIKLLSHSIGLLKNLTYLWISNENLPARSWISIFLSAILWRSANTEGFLSPSISGLFSLQWLDLSYCNLSDEDIPRELWCFSLLGKLDLAGNRFSSLPSTLCHLSNLEYLRMNNCTSLQSIPELPPNLVTLDASDCTSLDKLPDLSKLKNLQELDLSNCTRLTKIQGLINLNFLQTIHMEGCCNLASTFVYSLFEGYTEREINCDIFLEGREIPYWFNHQQMGSSISFDMPLDVENGLVGVTLWVVYASKDWNRKSLSARAYISDRRNAVEWTHSAAHKGTIAFGEILSCG